MAVCISTQKGIPKSPVESVRLVEDWGIEGDVHAGHWHRQVSLLALESIDKIRERGLDVGPGAFAENIVVAGLALAGLSVGDRIRVGGAQLEVTQIGKECHSRCAIYYRTGDCVMPREGVFCRVIRGGVVRAGEEARLERTDSGSFSSGKEQER